MFRIFKKNKLKRFEAKHMIVKLIGSFISKHYRLRPTGKQNITNADKI